MWTRSRLYTRLYIAVTTELNHIKPVTSIDPADAARLLARLLTHDQPPLPDRLPRMDWTVTGMGTLSGCPPAHADADAHHTLFEAWAQHLGLPAERQRFRGACDLRSRRHGMCHLRARGPVLGVDVMIWSAHHPKW